MKGGHFEKFNVRRNFFYFEDITIFLKADFHFFHFSLIPAGYQKKKKRKKFQ